MKNHRLPKWLRHNPYLVAGVVTVLALVSSHYGCAVQVSSPFSDRPVTRRQLDREAIEYRAKVKAKAEVLAASYEELDAKEAYVNDVVALVSSAVSTVPGPAGGLLTLGLGTLLGATALDNRRKDSKIKKESSA